MKNENKSKKGAARGYKDDELAGRLNKAASARLAILEKFRAKPGADDPGEIQRRAARREIAEARDLRTATQKASRSAEDAAKLPRAPLVKPPNRCNGLPKNSGMPSKRASKSTTKG